MSMKQCAAGALLAAALSLSSVAQTTPDAAPEAVPEAAPAAEPWKPADIKPADIVQRLTGETFVAILQEVGWTATLSANSDGLPYVNGSFTDADTGTAYEFQATLYRCEAASGCFDIVFTREYDSPTPITLKMVNTYNMNQIFGCAYLTAAGKVGLSLSHTIQGGVARQTIKEIADWWKTIVVAFPAKIAGG